MKERVLAMGAEWFPMWQLNKVQHFGDGIHPDQKSQFNVAHDLSNFCMKKLNDLGV